MITKSTSYRGNTARKWYLYVVGIMLAVGLAGLAGAALAASPLKTPGYTSKVVAAPRPPSHPYTVLYNQYNYAGTNNASSQNFEPALDAYDDEVADDFVNPGPDTWSVISVEVDGRYFNGNPPPGGPAVSVNVTFYNNSGGIPGSVLASRPAQAYTGPSGGQGDFFITLSTPVSVPPGTYWLSVQVNMDYGAPTLGRWGWTDRSVQTGNAAKWRNPGGGYSGGCTNWGNRYSCTLSGDTERDQAFRLLGPPAPTPTPCPYCSVLYDQNSSLGSTATNSQNFEATYDAFDDELADDFANPGPDTWSVTTIEVEGQYFGGNPAPGGPAASVNITFYNNSGGMPGSVLASRSAEAYTDHSGGLGDFFITLSTPVSLPPGTYWLSVRANMNFDSLGQWGWTDRNVLTGNPAMWQNPGSGWGSGCITWGTKTACGRTSSGPDQVFRLSGYTGPTPTPCGGCTDTPTPTVTATDTPIPPTNTFTTTNTFTPTNTSIPTSTSTSTPVISPTPSTAYLVGHVVWQQIPQNDPRSMLPITLTLKSGTTEINFPQQNTDSSGYFTVSVASLPNGTYNWRVQAPNGPSGGNTTAGFLSNCGTVGLAGAPQTNMENSIFYPFIAGCNVAPGCMRGGDSNNDNIVTIQDFGNVKAQFSQTGVRQGDFNNDLVVSIADFNILKSTFNQQGCSALP